MQDISSEAKPYDDAYLVLATNLVAYEPPFIIRRLMTDRKYLRRAIVREVKETDFHGLFLDSVIGTLYKEKQKQGLAKQLSDLGFFLYQQIDLPRLRDTVEQVYIFFYDEPLFAEA